VRDVLVAGWPWRTRVVVVVVVSLPSEPAYRNLVIQRLVLRWGRITRVANLEDTQRLANLLTRRAAEGNVEATSTPITDRPLGGADAARGGGRLGRDLSLPPWCGSGPAQGATTIGYTSCRPLTSKRNRLAVANVPASSPWRRSR
jgi:hypothetical protein